MSNQTVSVNRNFDDSAISGLGNGEDISIDTNATLTINSDVRWGQQAAVPGNLTISSTSGGKVLFDGRDVWWIPFDASTGNVPALGTCGTDDVTVGGSNVGEFLGVWTALGVAPSAAGGAMPASGFIKLRRKTATISDDDVLTFAGGATATVNSTTGGQRGWIHIVGEEASTITVPRLGELQAAGDWFLLGETNGSDDQTFQYPVTDNCPCLFIEDGSGGYEIWLNAANRWGAATVTIPTDVRGKFFGCVNSTGVITIARRVSNSCGYKPPSGRKVYCPNIIIGSSTSSNWAANTINATPATRWDITTSGGGKITLNKCTGTWYLYPYIAYSVSITDCGILHTMTMETVVSTIVMDRCGFGADGDSSTAIPLSLYYNNSVTMSRCVFMRYSNTADLQMVVRVQTNRNVYFDSCTFISLGSTSATTHASTAQYGLGLTDVKGGEVSDCVFIGCQLHIASSSDLSIYDTVYADCVYGETQTTNPFTAAIQTYSSSSNILIDGFSLYPGLTNVHPYSIIVTSGSGSNGIMVQNIGTPSAELDGGSANSLGYAVSFATCSDITCRRIYTKNIRNFAISIGMTAIGVTMRNVWGDGADSLTLYGYNADIKGARATISATAANSYGMHWVDTWTGTTTGTIVAFGHEPTAETAGQCSVYAGAPLWNGTGGVTFPALNDAVILTMSDFVLGVTSFANIAPTIRGSNASSYCTFQFQYDLGDGWNGAWLTLDAANLSGIGSGVIDPAIGVKLKLLITRTSGASIPVFTHAVIHTVTDATSQQIEYPLPQGATALVSNITINSRLQVYNVTTATELVNAEINAAEYSSTYTNGVGVSTGDVIRVRLTYTNGATAKAPFEALTIATASGWSIYATQENDAIYNAWAINGSAVTGFTADGANIDIDVAQGSYTKKQLAAWWMYYLTTAAGIRDFWGAFTLVSAAEIRQEVAVLDVKLQNTDDDTAVIFTDNDVRYYRSDFSLPYDTTAGSGAIYMDYSGVPLVNLSGTALTVTQQAQLALAARNSALIPQLV